MKPMPASSVLDSYFLEARSRLLDLAAILDRVGRGSEGAAVAADPRLQQLGQAVAIVAESAPDRARRVQELFSLPYDVNWKKPEPRQA